MNHIDILRKTKYEISRTLSNLEKSILSISENKPRILFVAPHLSTGGMPQYLYKKIEILSESAEVYCIQYSNTAEIYAVQRNRIRDFLGDRFICLGDDKYQILDLIEEICPDIIHFDDFVEFFIDKSIIEKIYSLDRPYFIYETCHSSNISPTDKLYVPDKFIMVNQWMVNKFESLGVPMDILEYPIENFKRPDRNSSLVSLGLDPNKKHVINVGLFTPGKNQGELIRFAKTLMEYPIEFHFIGNTAVNFSDYWEPLVRDLPGNCILWGESNETDKFYSAADLFIFNSIWELNPITIKESLSWKLPIMMRKLEPYLDTYDDNQLVHYMTNTEKDNINLILKLLNL